MNFKKALFKLSSLVVCVVITNSAQATSTLEDIQFLDGSFQTGFIANSNTSGQSVDLMLTNVVMGNPFPATIGWVKPYALEDEQKNAADYLVERGMVHMQNVENVYKSYYRSDDAQAPEEIYLAYDFLIYSETTKQINYYDAGGYQLPTNDQQANGSLFQKLIVFNKEAGLQAQKNLMVAQHINPFYLVDVTDSAGRTRQVKLGNMVLDVPYYESVSHIMRGNLAMERAFSLRFLTGMQTANPPINEELEELGWDTVNEQFYNNKGAWAEFTVASKIWLEVLKSPVQRQVLLEYAKARSLNYDDYQIDAFANASDEEKLVYDGYKDVVAIYKSMAQRARILREVSKRLILKLKREEAGKLIQRYVQQLAIEEAFISEFFYPDGLPANHAVKYPSLANIIVELRANITQASQLRLSALNPDLNPLGFDDNVIYIRAADSNNFTSTFDWFGNESLSTITGQPAGRLQTSMTKDLIAQEFRINFQHKAGSYMKEFEDIDNSYDNLLKEITGSVRGEPQLDSPETGGGLLQQQIRHVQLAENEIDRVKAQMENIHAWIETEQKLQLDLGTVSDKAITIIKKTGEDLGDLQYQISIIQGDMAFSSSMAAAASTSKKSVGGSIAHAANAFLQRSMQKKVGQKQQAITSLQTEKEATFEYLNREKQGLQSAAAIKRQYLQMRVLHIDLLNAQIRLVQEVDRLAQLYSKIEDYVNQKRLANVRLAQRSFADPTYRIEVTNAALAAESTFGELQSWFYLWFKSLEYKWPLTLVNNNATMNVLRADILRARTAKELADLRSPIISVNDDNSSNPNDTGIYYASFSLMKDNYGIKGKKKLDDETSLTVQQQLKIELEKALADDSTHVQIGGEVFFSIPFSTVRFDLTSNTNESVETEMVKEQKEQLAIEVMMAEEKGGKIVTKRVSANPAPLFGNGLWDSKIESVQVVVSGSNVYHDNPQQMPVRLRYGGSSYLITRDYSCITVDNETKAVNYRIYPPLNYTFNTAVGGISWKAEGNHLENQMTAQLTPHMPPNIPNEVFKSNNLRELPVAASDWRLLLPVNGINLSNILDININIIFKGRTAIARPISFDADKEICGVP